MPPPDSAVAIIPARLGSTRFPGKVLRADTGKPIVVHVCEQAAKAEWINRVVVATDADEVSHAVKAAGFESVLTSPEHTNGTSRLGEACDRLCLGKHEIVVNVQGDEPEIEPDVIDAAFGSLCPIKGPGHHLIGTAVAPLESATDFENPNIVKAAIASWSTRAYGVRSGRAIYFSRAPIPYPRNESQEPAWRHVGIYAYTVDSIRAYLECEPSPLEHIESLEQLRWYSMGYTVHAAQTNASHTGIDTEEQYRAFVGRHSARSSGK